MSKTGKDEVTREVILEAARRVFGKWGLNKATMEDIAREAGKGKSTLYYYYPTKEEIFHSVVEKELNGVLSRAKISLQGVNSAREKLRKYIAASVNEIRNSGALCEIARGEIATNPRFLLEVLGKFEPGELHFLHDILTLGVQQNQFGFANDQEQETAAMVVLEIVSAMELLLFVRDYDSRHLEIAARLIANGV